MKRILSVAAALALTVACSDAPGPSAVEAPEANLSQGRGPAFPSNATVTFGRDDVGTGSFPPGVHDHSFRANDKIVPRVVHIAAGGTVTFDVGTFHGISIFKRGKAPEDVDLTALQEVFPGAPPRIDDEDGRLARSAFFDAPGQWTSPAGTFDEPGRYLVICDFFPHFTEARMYAWVHVH